MRRETHGRGVKRCWAAFALLALLAAGMRADGQEDLSKQPPVRDADQAAKELDRVIAVVNNQVILASDLDMEMRIGRLLPIGDGQQASAEQSLDRLTTRALIEQQVMQEDPNGLEVVPKELEDGLTELRQNLPACKHSDCKSAAGWKAYLATLELTPEGVAGYWSNRMAVLRFIERRFRAGIRITPQEIQKYYRETLAPRYAKADEAPPLERIAPRIEEILLQQQVNALMNDWLKSLQDQGQVEILDPSLGRAGVASKPGGGR
jgi:peptidyl-prolyl cis-trans isomerase SurA